MSESANEASGAAYDEQGNDSVFDFLYHDARRVGSFIAQFNNFGLPTQVAVTEGVSKVRGRSLKITAGGGIPGIGNANLSFERGPGATGGMEAEERVYDPLWANARALLDYLTEREMIVRNLSRARIGQMVLITGSLVILDVQLLRGAWESKEVKKLINAGAPTPQPPNRQQRRAAAADNARPASNQVELMIDILKLLPHVMQARMHSKGAIAWCNLREEFLVPSAGDLTLKHGVAIAGDWHLLGIVDALPDDSSVDVQSALEAVGLAPALSHLPGVALANIVQGMGGVTRMLLGRPDDAFGITPILIFRTVIETAAGA